MAFVVVLEPCRQLRQDCLSVRAIVNIHVISLEGFDERFGHPVRLGTAHRRKAWHEAESGRKVDRFMRPIAAAVVREPLDRMRHSSGPEALLDALEHQIADHLTGNAAGTGTPGDRKSTRLNSSHTVI